MSVHQLKDKRFVCRHPKGKDPLRPNSTTKYFGRGKDAERKAKAFNDSLGLGKRKTISTPAFKELATAYLEAKEPSMAASTFESTCVKLEKTILPVIGNTQAHNITASFLDTYVLERSKTVKNTSIHRELSDVRAILRWAVKRRFIATNPMQDFEMPKRDDAMIQPPSEAEFTAILACAVPHIRRAMLITKHIGLRPGKEELLCLPWSSVDFINKTITVVSAKKGGIPLRIVPLNDVILGYLTQWHDEDEKNGYGYIIHYKGAKVLRVNKAWTAAKRRAKVLRRLPLYSVRHLFVTTLLERGADLKSVSEIAGSTPEVIMKWYQFVSTDLKRKTIDLLN